jgi:hypothetical protein
MPSFRSPANPPEYGRGALILRACLTAGCISFENFFLVVTHVCSIEDTMPRNFTFPVLRVPKARTLLSQFGTAITWR